MFVPKQRDVADHYHAITNISQGWADYVDAVKAVATQSPARRAEQQRDETKREVHVTGVPGSEKGSRQ